MTAPVWAQHHTDKPNIIIIYADDVGYGDIGAYGATLIPTPNIDGLAEEGLLFTQAYATAATCTPSRYSLLTGEYAFRNERALILPGDAPLLIEPGSFTLAEMLHQAGYRTSVVGKWHLGLGNGDIDWNGRIAPGPLEVGFDESFLLPATNDRVPTVFVNGHYVQGLSQEDNPLRVSYGEQIGDLPTGHSHPELLHYPADDQHSGTIVNGMSRIGWQDGGQSAWWDDEQIAPLFVEQSREFISREKEGPFFLYLSMHENHVPRWPNPQFVGKSQTGVRGDAIVELDWVVGQIVETLEALGIRKQTLVIFTSDNGPIYDDGYQDGAITEASGHKANGPLRGGKYLPYEGGTRVPFIASWPGNIEQGKRTDALFCQVDFLASLAVLVGADIPEQAGPDSFDRVSTLLGKSTAGREYIVQQSALGLAIRKGQWKLIPAETSPKAWADAKHNARQNPISTPMWPEGDVLYNLQEDPGESKNVAEHHAAIVSELKNLLEAIRRNPEKNPNKK